MLQCYHQRLCKNSLVETFAWYSAGPLLHAAKESFSEKILIASPEWESVRLTQDVPLRLSHTLAILTYYF